MPPEAITELLGIDAATQAKAAAFATAGPPMDPAQAIGCLHRHWKKYGHYLFQWIAGAAFTKPGGLHARLTSAKQV